MLHGCRQSVLSGVRSFPETGETLISRVFEIFYLRVANFFKKRTRILYDVDRKAEFLVRMEKTARLKMGGR